MRDDVALEPRRRLDGDRRQLRHAARCAPGCSAASTPRTPLVVLGCLLALGVPLADAAAALGRMHGRRRAAWKLIEPGRAEAAGRGRLRAHARTRSPRRLSALREHCRGALWCVFGCGGDRDPGKRPMMGAVADELADRIIVTDDNPRSEDPQPHHPRRSRGGITAHAARVDSRPRRGDRGGARRGRARATWCSSPARDTRIIRSTATSRRSFSDRRRGTARSSEAAA